MTNEQILELIGAKPGIRTIEIVDRLDCEIDVLQKRLEDLVALNLITAYKVTAPNNRPATAYTLKNAVVAESAPAPSAPPAVQMKKVEVPKMTKIEIAINYIKSHGGTATASELHSALNLKPDEYPSSWLCGGVKDGRLIKDGKNWSLGTGVPAPKAVDKPVEKGAPTAARNLPALKAGKAEPDQQAPDPAPAAASAPKPEMAPAPELKLLPVAINASPGFACALWSHGELQLVRAGVVVAALTPEETKQLCDYLDRLGDPIAA